MSVPTPQGALDALAALQSHFLEVASLRAAVGQAESPLEAAARFTRGSPMNPRRAEGWVREAGAAERAAGLTRQHVLQDPARAVLAQANVRRDAVFRLLS
jgi:flagellin-like hook-associated protein FlgL